MASVPFIGAMDLTKLTFGPFENLNGKTKVELYRDPSSTLKSNRLNRFALCADAIHPMSVRFPLDSVRDDSTNPYRRNQVVVVSDPETRAALHSIDETIVKKAIEMSKEWFKGKQLSEDQVRMLYKPLLYKAKEEDEFESVKMKIKCPGVDYPTGLHVRELDGFYRKNGGKLEHLTYGAMVAPIVSASYGIWFMGGHSFGLSLQAEDVIITPGEACSDGLSQFPSSTPLLTRTKEEEESKVKAEEEAPPGKKIKSELIEEDEGERAM